jgi:cob(I)alamin adenosyltransferase
MNMHQTDKDLTVTNARKIAALEYQIKELQNRVDRITKFLLTAILSISAVLLARAIADAMMNK